MKSCRSAISSPQPGAPFGSLLCWWVVQFLCVRINRGTVVGRGCRLEDITLNERVHALAGASAGDNKAAGGCATSGAQGNDDETVGCAASVAEGSDDEAMEGCTTSGAGGGG